MSQELGIPLALGNRLSLGTALVMLLSVVLTGCGSGNDATPAPPAATSAAAAVAAPASSEAASSAASPSAAEPASPAAAAVASDIESAVTQAQKELDQLNQDLASD